MMRGYVEVSGETRAAGPRTNLNQKHGDKQNKYKRNFRKTLQTPAGIGYSLKHA
jgi:hypothetical protein